MTFYNTRYACAWGRCFVCLDVELCRDGGVMRVDRERGTTRSYVERAEIQVVETVFGQTRECRMLLCLFKLKTSMNDGFGRF